MTEIDVKYFLTCLLMDIISAFLVNAFFGLFASESVPMWGVAEGRDWFISPESLFMDLFWINLYTGFFVVIFVTWNTREDMEKGKVNPPAWNRKDIPVLKHFPKITLLRALMFSTICLLTFFPLGVLTLLLLQVESLPYWNFVIMKALYGVIVSVPTAFTVRVWALGDGMNYKKKYY